MASVAEVLAHVPDCPKGFRSLEQFVADLGNGHCDADFSALARSARGAARTEVRMVGALCCARVADEAGFTLLETLYAADPDWRVREMVARAFDQLCAGRGYDAALPTIRRWLTEGTSAMRRAVSEGLRPWSSRGPFRAEPGLAIALLAPLRHDPDDSTRLSAANALSDISKKHPDLVQRELASWDLAQPHAAAVAKRASRHL